MKEYTHIKVDDKSYDAGDDGEYDDHTKTMPDNEDAVILVVLAMIRSMVVLETTLPYILGHKLIIH